LEARFTNRPLNYCCAVTPIVVEASAEQVIEPM
jgi:hypothetical protein